jgi:hypothetical protein
LTERPSFESKYILKELDKISSNLSNPVTIFVIGGLALIEFGLKEATKDIDVVVQSKSELAILKKTLESLGYHSPNKMMITRPYKKMDINEILENDDKFRWDIFYGKICGALSFTPEMISRAKPFYKKNLLSVLLASKEDIFLFKGITERAADLDDMRLLAESKVDWKIVETECYNQSNYSGIIWENALYGNLVDLRKIYNIRSPIENNLKKVVEEKLTEEAIIKALKAGKKTISAISESAELPEYFIRIHVDKLEKKGKISINRSKRPYSILLNEQ